jgi:hypothetical protein
LPYRVFGYVFVSLIWPWQTEIYKWNLVWRGFWNPETWKFYKLQSVFVESMVAPSMVQFANIQIFFGKKEFKCTYCIAIFIILFQYFCGFFDAFLFCPLVKGKKLFFGWLVICYCMQMVSKICNNLLRKKKDLCKLDYRWRTSFIQ